MNDTYILKSGRSDDMVPDKLFVVYLEQPLNDNPDERELNYANTFMFIPDPRHILTIRCETLKTSIFTRLANFLPKV